MYRRLFFVFTVFVCYLVVVVGMLYFCSNLCNFSCADRVNCQHLFLDFYLLCLPNISLCFRAAFLNILVHLFWLPFRDEILIRFSHSHNFITTTTFPQNNNSEKLKMSINSFLFCYVAHHTLSPCLFACFSCFFHQYRQLQAAPSSTNSILHNVLLEKKETMWWLPSSFLLQGILLKSCFYCVLMTSTSGPHKLPLVSSLNHPRLWILIRIKKTTNKH